MSGTATVEVGSRTIPEGTTVVEVETDNDHVVVIRDADNKYHVVRDGVVRHPNCEAEAVMRALGFYLHGALYKLSKTAQPG